MIDQLRFAVAWVFSFLGIGIFFSSILVMCLSDIFLPVAHPAKGTAIKALKKFWNE